MKKVKNKKPANLLVRLKSARKVLVLGSAAVLAVVAFAVSPWGMPGSHAYSGNQWCAKSGYGTLACLNAWSGGPWVKVSGRGAANNYFNLIQDGTGNSYFKFTGPGNWYNHCIGDAYNDPNQKHLSSLNPCGRGWGTYFNAYTACDNYTGWTFKNVHSGKFLSLSGFTSGSSVYLDSNTPTCWHSYQ
jgi:hypothetical protein